MPGVAAMLPAPQRPESAARDVARRPETARMRMRPHSQASASFSALVDHLFTNKYINKHVFFENTCFLVYFQRAAQNTNSCLLLQIRCVEVFGSVYVYGVEQRTDSFFCYHTKGWTV